MIDAHKQTIKVIKEYEHLCKVTCTMCSSNKRVAANILDDALEISEGIADSSPLALPFAGIVAIGGFIGAGVAAIGNSIKNSMARKKAWESIEETFEKIKKNSKRIIPKGRKALEEVIDDIYIPFIKRDLRQYLLQSDFTLEENKKDVCEKLRETVRLLFRLYTKIELGEKILFISNNYEERLNTDLRKFSSWCKKETEVNLLECYKNAYKVVYNSLSENLSAENKSKIDDIFNFLNYFVPINFELNTNENSLSSDIEKCLSATIIHKTLPIPTFYQGNENLNHIITVLSKRYEDKVKSYYWEDEKLDLFFIPLIFTGIAAVIGVILRLIFKKWIFSIILTSLTFVGFVFFGICSVVRNRKERALHPFEHLKKCDGKNLKNVIKRFKETILENELKINSDKTCNIPQLNLSSLSKTSINVKDTNILEENFINTEIKSDIKKVDVSFEGSSFNDNTKTSKTENNTQLDPSSMDDDEFWTRANEIANQ